MRASPAWAITLLCAAPLLAQTKPSSKATSKPVSPISLSGCVQRGETTPNQYTLSDLKGGTTYRLTGTKVADFLGQRVLVVGGVPSKRLVIAGGLYPSPNVAAQAGAMDPSRAATAAAAGAAAPGVVQLPEFRVKSVRPVTGTCPR